jgi:lipopolysaccharide/colanic/teichoic acid biosynthesis glycosyltransferase
MFFVGPRPHPIGLLIEGMPCTDRFADYLKRCSVKPGMTGWAQVHALTGPIRSAATLRSVIDHDLHYIRHHSPTLDALIVLKTLALFAAPLSPLGLVRWLMNRLPAADATWAPGIGASIGADLRVGW